MNKLQITPPVTIVGSVGADVSHDQNTTVTVTATNPDTGAKETFDVKPGETKHWDPPAGWLDVQFTADGFQQETRVIVWQQVAGAAEA